MLDEPGALSRREIQCAPRRRPDASPAGRGDRRQERRRDRHLERLFGALVQPGTGQDRRPPDHVRHRQGPLRDWPGTISSEAGVDCLVTQVLGNAHEEVARLKDPIDLLFIDADKQGYLDYLTKLLPLVRPGGLIVAHNMASPPPDPAFVKAITTNPELETLFVNMHDQGLGVSLKKR